MANLSSLRTEIENVSEILKITGAMELVATAKLKKIGVKTNNLIEYVKLVHNSFVEIMSNAEKSPYLFSENKKYESTLWILVDSNLGMCGSYNSANNKLLFKNYKDGDQVYAIGSKAVSFCKSNKFKIWKSNLNVDVTFTSDDSIKIANMIQETYLTNEFQSIKLIYQHFINNMTTESRITDVLPIVKTTNENDGPLYEFEPSPDEVLETTVSLYLNTLIYGSFIEGQLCEFTSRRNAMEAANKNGFQLNRDLMLQFNRKRQEKITNEITEIIAGTNAQGG